MYTGTTLSRFWKDTNLKRHIISSALTFATVLANKQILMGVGIGVLVTGVAVGLGLAFYAMKNITKEFSDIF